MSDNIVVEDKSKAVACLKAKIDIIKVQIARKTQDTEHTKVWIGIHKNHLDDLQWTLNYGEINVREMGIRRYNYALLLASLAIIPLISAISVSLYNEILSLDTSNILKIGIAMVVFILYMVIWIIISMRYSKWITREPSSNFQNTCEKTEKQILTTQKIIGALYIELEKKNTEIDELYIKLDEQMKTLQTYIS